MRDLCMHMNLLEQSNVSGTLKHCEELATTRRAVVAELFGEGSMIFASLSWSDAARAHCYLLRLIEWAIGYIGASASPMQVNAREVHLVVHDDHLQIANECLDRGGFGFIDGTGSDVGNDVGSLRGKKGNM